MTGIPRSWVKNDLEIWYSLNLSKSRIDLVLHVKHPHNRHHNPPSSQLNVVSHLSPRWSPSAPQQFGNKLSILSGDFLLGRASVALARLGNNEVVELLATVIANLVEGEVMQLRSPISGTAAEGPTDEAFEMYMRKTYLKTASLMAKSARATVILGGCGHGKSAWVKEAAYAYGRNLGIAFQVSVLR
jgi:geranylgeranyl pyrophosphate synthase